MDKDNIMSKLLDESGLHTLLNQYKKYVDKLHAENSTEPYFDEETGRYTNDSIERYLDTFTGGVYGVKIPIFDKLQLVDTKN